MITKPYSRIALQQQWTRQGISAPGKIVIISKSGAGSSTQLKQLKKILPGNNFFSCGDLMRKRQAELGFETIGDFVAHIEAYPEEGHDEWLDKNICHIGHKYRHLIIEGRLPHILIPRAYTVFLDCSLPVRAERRRKQLRDEKGVIISWKKALTNIVVRDSNDWNRNTARYPGCDWRPEDFDLVVSTEFLSKQEVTERILAGRDKWLANGMRN